MASSQPMLRRQEQSSSANSCTNAFELSLAAELPQGDPPATANMVSSLFPPFGVVGVSHRTAGLELRSKLAFTQEQIPELLERAREAGLAECAILATCNRTELYFSGGSAQIAADLLSSFAGICTEALAPSLYEHSCVCAACHLFRVTAGLDSAVIGESEVVAQVREAKALSDKAGMHGPMLHLLFNRAMEASKRIRTETDLCRTPISIATLAVRETVIAPKHATYALIGAGKIAARLAKELLPVRRGKTIVVNRTPSNSTEIAAILKAEIRGLDELAPTLAEADVVFAAAAGMSPIVDSSSLSEIANIRAGRPLLVIDLGLPPNLGEGALPNGVRVVRLDELTAKAEANEESRNAAVKHSAAILDEEVERFAEALIERAASPTIRALLEFGENVGKKNIEWALERLPEIDQKQRRVLEELVRRTVVGMLESPIHSLKTDLAWAERRHLLENLFSIGGGE